MKLTIDNDLLSIAIDLAAQISQKSPCRARWRRQSGRGKFAEWRGAFAFAPTGPGVADFVQISLGWPAP
ncbi:hypothetical protein [Mesorhizobium loti]|uniref:hypothetical protein n=1 Tax=Rhizobium loti TaxID=381 RepID=UPI0007EC6FE9|nr:hypothetical protein [Mesorhizobium loti]